MLALLGSAGSGSKHRDYQHERFALERYDPTGKTISGVGLSAYVKGGSLLAVAAFARTLNSAVIVHISAL